MLIRSQDKRMIANLDNIYTVSAFTEDNDEGIYVENGMGSLLVGRYSTKEKSVKVLDMIEKAYVKAGFAKAIVSEMAKVLGRASTGIDDELAKSAGEALVKLMCFQMPADNEVEL